MREHVDKEKINKAFQAIIPRLDSLPLPNVMTSRLLMALGGKCTAEELKEIIEADPAITLQVLKVSNSAYYGQRSRIQNIERAILLMGIEEIRNICLSICLIAKFNPADRHAKSFHMDYFWHHSLLTASTAARLASQKDWIKSEDAFILGLLHDIGKTVFAVALPTVFDKIAGIAGTTSGCAFYEIESRAGLSHTLIGSWIATRWGLPPIIRSVIEYHHDPDEVIDEFAGPVSLIDVANAATNTVLPDPLCAHQQEEFPSAWSLDKLNIMPEDYPEIVKETEDAISDTESIYSVLKF